MRWLAAPVVALLLGAACGDDDDGAADGAGCVEAMATAAAEPDSARARPLIIATLSACDSASQWIAALEEHPAAMGLTTPEGIGNADARVACLLDREASTPVCRDVQEQQPQPN